MAHVYETPTARRQIPNFSHQETPAPAALDPKYIILAIICSWANLFVSGSQLHGSQSQRMGRKGQVISPDRSLLIAPS
jgi:hypothetical protein